VDKPPKQERLNEMRAAVDAASRSGNKLGPLLALVAEQADDDGLWFEAATAPEAYLQAALRKLHAAVERA